jgi:hypothetical protein
LPPSVAILRNCALAQVQGFARAPGLTNDKRVPRYVGHPRERAESKPVGCLIDFIVALKLELHQIENCGAPGDELRFGRIALVLGKAIARILCIRLVLARTFATSMMRRLWAGQNGDAWSGPGTERSGWSASVPLDI